MRTGGHIHFGSLDGGGDFRPHVRVLKLFKAMEDLLYRLGNDPEGRYDRNLWHVKPNPVPPTWSEIRSIEALRNLQVDGLTGEVVSIRWRYTALATVTNVTIIIPNGELMKSKVTLLGRRGDERVP